MEVLVSLVVATGDEKTAEAGLRQILQAVFDGLQTETFPEGYHPSLGSM
jgi:hypothetical protein